MATVRLHEGSSRTLHGRMDRVEHSVIPMGLNQPVCYITGKLIYFTPYRILRIEQGAYLFEGKDRREVYLAIMTPPNGHEAEWLNNLLAFETPWDGVFGRGETLSKVQGISSLFRCDIDVPSFAVKEDWDQSLTRANRSVRCMDMRGRCWQGYSGRLMGSGQTAFIGRLSVSCLTLMASVSTQGLSHKTMINTQSCSRESRYIHLSRRCAFKCEAFTSTIVAPRTYDARCLSFRLRPISVPHVRTTTAGAEIQLA